MELRHLRYFTAVAEELSFTRAARRVGIGQPPLSQQIRDLEDELGTPLFRRLPHGVELTEAGRSFLPEARATLAQAERATRAARRAGAGETGRLRVGFASSASFHAIVPASLGAFRRAYPLVDLSLEETHTTRLLERLAAGALDAVFVRAGAADPEGVQLHPLVIEPMGVVLPVGHRLARAKSVRLSALREETFLLFPRSAGVSLFDEIVGQCRRAGFEPTVEHAVQEAPQLTSISNFVAAGLGISVLPRSLARLRVPGVRFLPVAGDVPVARLTLALRPDESSPTAHNFVATVLAEQRRVPPR
jgi:DNA-binding transcriptional LysR family regulator